MNPSFGWPPGGVPTWQPHSSWTPAPPMVVLKQPPSVVTPVHAILPQAAPSLPEKDPWLQAFEAGLANSTAGGESHLSRGDVKARLVQAYALAREVSQVSTNDPAAADQLGELLSELVIPRHPGSSLREALSANDFDLTRLQLSSQARQALERRRKHERNQRRRGRLRSAARAQRDDVRKAQHEREAAIDRWLASARARGEEEARAAAQAKAEVDVARQDHKARAALTARLKLLVPLLQLRREKRGIVPQPSRVNAAVLRLRVTRCYAEPATANQLREVRAAWDKHLHPHGSRVPQHSVPANEEPNAAWLPWAQRE